MKIKQLILSLSLVLFTTIIHAQSDKEEVEKTCMNYIEGFYQGDASKLEAALDKKLYKKGYYKKDGKFGGEIPMTYDEALQYADRVKKNERFAKPGSPKEVIILDVMDKIAAVKVKAYWGYDYLLLAKKNDKWVIQEVLWQGPVE